MSQARRVGWLEAKADDAEFQRLRAREDLVEDFLDAVLAQMALQGVSRSELARRLGCQPANVTRILRRTTNLTASTMADMAFALDLQVRLEVRPAARKWFAPQATRAKARPAVRGAARGSACGAPLRSPALMAGRPR